MMPKDYEAAAKQIAAHHGAIGESTGRDIALEVARARYALHCKPQRELTQDQWKEISRAGINLSCPGDYAKAIVAAYQRKQQEPETVKFRAARNRNDHSEIYMAKADSDWSGSNWEWLPGEPQTIEVKLP